MRFLAGMLFAQPKLFRSKPYVFFKASDKMTAIGKACLLEAVNFSVSMEEKSFW